MARTLISNPPYNMKWDIPIFAQMQTRFSECELPPKSNANYAFVLTALKESDKSVFILPGSVLSGGTKEEEAIRKHLVDKNLIESVILCPDNMFESTTIATCIIVLNNHKTSAQISMIDMRQSFDVEQREQRGQFGGKSHTNRVYKKEVKIFTDEHMQRAINVIENKEDIAEFSKHVSIKDIIDNNYSLQPSKYIEFKEKESKSREYSEIIEDINRVINDKNLCKLTMNESIAKSIGIYDLYLLCKESMDTNKEMNNALSFTGKEIAKENFIAITKNKNEIKFENNSKDKLSTIFLSIMQMWKQNIMYLNQEENRYLVELRDKLLPDLMSGKIKLGSEE